MEPTIISIGYNYLTVEPIHCKPAPHADLVAIRKRMCKPCTHPNPGHTPGKRNMHGTHCAGLNEPAAHFALLHDLSGVRLAKFSTTYAVHNIEDCERPVVVW